jgi:hypothetical protein
VPDGTQEWLGVVTCRAYSREQQLERLRDIGERAEAAGVLAERSGGDPPMLALRWRASRDPTEALERIGALAGVHAMDFRPHDPKPVRPSDG